MSDLDRFVRTCPVHRLALEESGRLDARAGRLEALRCPAGHLASRWVVVDEDTGEAVASGSYRGITVPEELMAALRELLGLKDAA